MKSILFAILLSLNLFPVMENDTIGLQTDFAVANEDLKIRAFEVLKTKCNVCHEKKNKDRVFTKDNMNKNAKKINRQVFKWKRMPKGDDIKLTEKEKEQLKSWIYSLK